jgi:hypothetical protein
MPLWGFGAGALEREQTGADSMGIDEFPADKADPHDQDEAQHKKRSKQPNQPRRLRWRSDKQLKHQHSDGRNPQ